MDGRDQLENAIKNYPGYINSEIDLTPFMDEEQTARVKDAWQYRDRLRDLILGRGEYGLTMPWDGFHGNIEFRKSEMTLWAGFKGHGKSAVISQVLEHLIANHGQRVFIISPEFPAHRVLYRMMVQSISQRYPHQELLAMWLDAVRDKLWIYDQQKSLTPRDVPALCRYAIQVHGVNHILIDSLMKCGIPPDDYGAQKKLVDTIQQVCHNTEAHVHLIAHLRKGKSDDEIGGLHDIKGASEIGDLVENVIICWRNKAQELRNDGSASEPDAVIKVEAQRNGEGWIGKIPMKFDKHSMRYSEWTDCKR